MKVNVITINEIKVPRWRRWSDWIDVAVFNFCGTGHLLQLSVNRRNKKRFRAIPFKTFGHAAYASVEVTGDLKQMEAADA